MGFPVFVQFEYQSRYALLGVMARELADAFAEKGCEINPPGVRAGVQGAPACVILWLNFLASMNDLKPEITRAGSRAALVQFFVDHPLALWPEQMDALSRLDNFRMCLPCLDGAHLLRLRWPRLRHVHCLHGVSRAALADRESIGAPREDGLLVMGSIHTEAEVAAVRAKAPGRLLRGADEIVELMVAHPWMPFEQAAEVALAPMGALVGDWNLLTGVWKYVSAAVNRRRRVALVRAMEGAPTVVYGAEAWKEFCRGGAGAPDRSTIEFRGDLPYAETSAALKRARACLAWGPTQFTHSFSERLLLSLGAGCATVADDRLLVRRHFACEGVGAEAVRATASAGADVKRSTCVRVFDAADAASARAAVEALLADPERRAAMGLAGRDEIERAHLWAHRVDTIAAVGADALAA